MRNFDRGIIKWLPFDALSGYKEAIFNLKLKRSKISRPILSDDQINQLNYELTKAINLKKNVTVYYFLSGQIYYQTGFIVDVDRIKKRIKLDKHWLNANNILKIEIN